ncbi:hypothetical protein [Desulforhopalus sp. 52FAK]
MQKSLKTRNIQCFLTVLIIGLLPLASHASTVNGRYLKGSGSTITLEISVGKPAPSSIIVEQSFSQKNKVTAAQPKPNKMSGNGNAKWLLKNIKPGKKRFTLQLASPLKGSIRGVVRYKDPASGKFLEQSFTP